MAVYTPLTAAQVAAFLQPLGLGDYLRHEGITQGVENTNYHVFTTAGRYVLTVFEKRVDPASLPFVFSYMAHLARAGLNVPSVLAGGTLAGKPAAVISFLAGRDVPEDELNESHCEQAGAMLANMHLAAKTFVGTRANPVGHDEWLRLFAAFQGRIAPAQAARIQNVLDAYVPRPDLPSGAVHADYFADNVFFENGALSGVIDFYFACTAPFIYDAAIALNAWCIDRQGHVHPGRVNAFCRAYEAVRPLNDAERAAFPDLRRAAALRFIMTRQYDWVFTPEGADVNKKDPAEYFAKMDADITWPS